MKHSVLSCLATALLCLSPAAPFAATIESLGQPCRAKNILSGRVIYDAKADKEWLVLGNTNEASNVELLFVDFESNTGKAVKAPAGQGAWVLEPVTGNRLVVGTYYDGKFMVFDLDTMQFVKTVGVPHEEYLFASANPGDGKLYGGTYPGAKLAALDLSTYQVKAWSAAPATDLYLRWLTPMADGRILCNYGMPVPVAMIFDPAKESFTSAPQSGVELRLAAAWNGYLIAGEKAYDGKTLQKLATLPFPAPDAKLGSWSALKNLTSSETLYLRQGEQVYRFRAGQEKLEALGKVPSLYLGAARGVSKSGKFVGAYGQDYFAVRPGEADGLRPIPVASSGRPPHFIKTDHNGKLWGGPMFGQTLFWVDLKTSQPVNTDIVSPHGGEVYDIAFRKGKVYAVSYSGGEIIECDPSRPFDIFKAHNPHTVLTLGPNYIRPTAGIKLGPDGKLYSGWMARYGTYGGAVSVYDPETSHAELIENPLGAQGIEGLDVDEASLYLGTTTSGNGMPPNQAARAKFAVMDLATRKVGFEHEFTSDTRAVSQVQRDAQSGAVVMVAQGKLVGFDPKIKSFLRSFEALPAASGIVDVPGNGKLYYASQHNLIVADIASGKVEQSIALPGKAEKVSVEDASTVYVTSGPELYRVKLGQ